MALAQWGASLAHFLVSEWIWSMTWALGLAPLSICIMIVLLLWSERYSLLGSIVLSVVVQGVGCALFSLLVAGLLIYTLQVPYDPESYLCSPLCATLSLAALYTIAQSLILVTLNVVSPVCLRRIIIIVGLSNLLSALIIYLWT